MFSDTRFWVGLSVVTFVVLTYKTVKMQLDGFLNKRSERIREDLENAAKLRAEAEALLDEYNERLALTKAEVQRILDNAELQLRHIVEESKRELEEQIASKTASAAQRITNLENSVLQEVRSNAVEIAILAVHSLVRSRMGQDLSEDFINSVVNDINKQLN
jgi:F-type H+-transporting ATPase subunit b